MRSRLNRGDWVIILSVAAVFIAVANVWTLEAGFAVGITAGVFVAVIQAKWDSRRDWRVWLILSVLAAVHVAVIVAFRLPEIKVGLAVTPFAIAEGLVILALINWMEKHFPAHRQ